MKFHQEFTVEEPIETLWAFFEEPQAVACCMPGVDTIETLDPDTFLVQVTQRVGPISATFESRVHIVERVAPERIAFNATGKAIRGAIGNFRAETVVRLVPEGAGTRVLVESEAALAGVLGSVGQKVIARQAEKITAEFSRNLQTRLGGEPEAAGSTAPAGTGAAVGIGRPALRPAAAPAAVVASGGEGWAKVAAALSLVNILVGLAILCKLA